MHGYESLADVINTNTINKNTETLLDSSAEVNAEQT